MNRKAMLMKKIHELDFALHELNLYLDTHPTSLKAMELLKEYRKKRKMAVEMYDWTKKEYPQAKIVIMLYWLVFTGR